MLLTFKLGDIAVLKKEHPCKNRCKEFEIIRVGADIRIKCLGCGRTILLPREEFEIRVDYIKPKN